MFNILQYKEFISNGVQRLRRDHRWTQGQFAKILGLSQSRFSQIERGQGSFTAEQFLVILKVFNISLDYFLPVMRKEKTELQNALARFGATHLYEDNESLPSEKFSQVTNVIYETLVGAESSRQVIGLAPVIVLHSRNINLNKLKTDLQRIGFVNRVGWLVENILFAVKYELGTISQQGWISKYKRAETILNNFAKFCGHFAQENEVEDIFDSKITSEKTIEDVKKMRSDISKKWHIISRIMPEDFAKALDAARNK